MLLCVSGVLLLDLEGEPLWLRQSVASAWRCCQAQQCRRRQQHHRYSIHEILRSAMYPWHRFVSPAPPCHALNTVLRLSLENFSRWKRPGPATNLQERMRSLPKWS
jgi:hypothetical protein